MFGTLFRRQTNRGVLPVPAGDAINRHRRIVVQQVHEAMPTMVNRRQSIRTGRYRLTKPGNTGIVFKQEVFAMFEFNSHQRIVCESTVRVSVESFVFELAVRCSQPGVQGMHLLRLGIWESEG